MTVTLYDFRADWCGPCKTQEPILDELEAETDYDFTLEKVDVDEDQETANEYDVRSLPTLIVTKTDDEGDEEKVVQKFIGVTQRDDLEEAIDDATSEDGA